MKTQMLLALSAAAVFLSGLPADAENIYWNNRNVRPGWHRYHTYGRVYPGYRYGQVWVQPRRWHQNRWLRHHRTYDWHRRWY